MADIVRRQDEQFPQGMRVRYKDMDDTTHSPVVYIGDGFVSLSDLIEDQIALGNISGVENVSIAGRNPDIDAGTNPEDIWDVGGLMTYSTSANIDTISSSDDTDDQTLLITGQTFDGVQVTQTKALNGQAKVTLDTPLWRVYKPIFNIDNTTLAGDVYIYINGAAITDGVPEEVIDIRAKIIAGKNSAFMTHYTVPANKQAIFLQGTACIATGANAVVEVELYTRLAGGVFIGAGSLALDSTGVGCKTVKIEARSPLPARTDIVIRVVSSSVSNIAVTGQNEFRLYPS